MADSVSTILDYLRQHHFLQAEAALKAELAGRELSNGLFSIDVDLGLSNGDKVPLKEFDPQEDSGTGCAQLFGLNRKTTEKSEKRKEVGVLEEKKVQEIGKGGSSLDEGFWDQKDELLWVPGNKQGLQMGKVHPLDELGNPQGKKKVIGARIKSVVHQADESQDMSKQQQPADISERSGGLPRLPPVRLKSSDKIPDEWGAHGRENSEADIDIDALEGAQFALGSFLDVPVGQDISSSGTKRSGGSNRPSVSQGIVEDPTDLLSSFATVGDGSAVDFPDDYWDSDAYEDDEDPGYTRRTIEDQAAFLANEIHYPSEEERARMERLPGHQGTYGGKYDDDEDRSYVESYFSGEEYYRTREAQHGNDYDGQLLDPEELKQIRSEPAWQGFVVQGNSVRKDQAADTATQDEFSREIRETYLAESSEGEVGSLQDCELNGYGKFKKETVQGFKELGGPSCAEDEERELMLQYYRGTWTNGAELQQERNGNLKAQVGDDQLGGFQFGGFSFPSPSSAGEVEGSRAESGRSIWSARDVSSRGEDPDRFTNGFVIGPDDTVSSWKRKSSESSPIISGAEDHDHDDHDHVSITRSTTVSPGSTDDDCLSVEEDRVEDEDVEDEGQRQETEVAAAYDEEAIAVHEHFQRLQAEEDEFETFDLKIIHRKNRTGFEEEKDFPVVINSVIAGRYHVTEYLGSAAFSKAIQAHDLHTGMDVCMKIIKNNKDFFDQSLDEIKLLKYINKHDPADKYHILRLYDYFYHREHLFIVCELLRANLYEFHKYNRDSGGEVYFTMPRLQSITRQCLEALEFLHGLGLIHCDLKPENILVKSYSRCEVKVIDLGSSCFQSDHLCSYVQSRSYRAPEVILGLPYDQKIDIWSLGCILAELCSGNVLFQNDSLSTLLARVVGIIGPLDPEMVAKGRESYKFLTKGNMLYERNQETQRMEYLIPKKTTLAHRLPMGDPGFIDFVGYLLQINPKNRPSAAEAATHPWLSYPYEPISS